MTVAAPELAPVAVAPPAALLDPHAPKLSPDDPRLRIGRPAARTLRTGPLVAVAAGLMCAMMFAVTFALQTPRATSKDRPDPSAAPPPPVVPEAIRNAPAAPRPIAARSDAGSPAGELRASRGGSPSPEEMKRHMEEEQDLRARSTGVLFDTPGESPNGPELGRPAAPPPATAASPTSPAAPPGASDSDPNLQDRKNAFLEGVGSKTSDYLSAGVQHPRSPYEVKAGTIIPAVLVTGINSDLPGPVIGQVREHVYDTVSGNYLLIPQGSRLLAHYDSMVAWGQERVLVCWNRLIFPNGDSVNLQCMPAADLKGAAGLTDEVDEHWMRILKGAAVATLLAATTTAVAGNTDGFNPTVPQVWARNAAGEVNQVGQQLTRRNLNIQPTITVRPGFSVNVVVTKDIVLAPYAEPPLAGAPR
jgi:type IV secretory pathway VirB10-like protein